LQAPRDAGFILLNGICDIKQRAKTKFKTGSLKAASQSQKHIYNTAKRIPQHSQQTLTTIASTQGRRIYPAEWYLRHKTKSKNKIQNRQLKSCAPRSMSKAKPVA